MDNKNEKLDALGELVRKSLIEIYGEEPPFLLASFQRESEEIFYIGNILKEEIVPALDMLKEDFQKHFE